MKSTMMHVQLSTNQLLDRAGLFFPEREVVSRHPDKSYSRLPYSDVRRRARQLAQALVAAGVQRGEAVATLMWNHNAHLEAYFGIPAAGAVLHTLNLRLSPDDIAYIIHDADDKVILVDDVLLPLWEKVQPLLKIKPRVVVHAFSKAAVPAGYDNYEDFIAKDASTYAYPVQDENEAMGMCYTSGTTGRPKGVVYSHRSMVLHATAGAMPDAVGLSVRDNVMMVTPMFHANAWAVPFSAMLTGANQLLPGPHLGGEDLLDMMESEKASLALGVPTIWMMILQGLQNPTRPRKLHKPMRMLVGGAAVPIAMIKAFQEFDMHIVHGWGMTETSPLGSIGYPKPADIAKGPDAANARRAMQGLAAPHVELRIRTEEGVIQPWDGESVGEIQCRGPWITGGYHNTPTDPGKFTEDGWLRTGDMGVIDPQGYLRLVDRAKDLIKSGGEWISSVDLENTVMAHPAVAEAAVIAVKHPKWDERPLVAIVVKQGQSVTPEELRSFLAPHFAKWQLPDDFAFMEAIPRTSTGKFLKTKLREMFADYQSKTP